MKRSFKIILLPVIALLITDCSKSRGIYEDLESSLKDKHVTFDNIKILYVFDEYSCSTCSENLYADINVSTSNEVKVLYATKNPDRFLYRNSLLFGYVNQELVVPVQYGIINLLRETTNTYKGNYKLVIDSGSIVEITDF